jgi:hypothetical protein
MLRVMGFVAQWRTIERNLEGGWGSCTLRLAVARPQDADRALRLLGPASPGRTGGKILLQVGPERGFSASATERLFARLDAEAIAGTLELQGFDEPEPTPVEAAEVKWTSLAGAWDGLLESLPDGWSDLLCLVELRSSDDLAPAALALAPVNPSRQNNELAFRFRVAHRFGYGAAPQMARRCLARLDERGIPGTVRVLEELSDTRPLLTQGPTFVAGGRAV